MSKGVAGAIAVILLWMSFAAFFVAFHPGGIRSDTFKSDSNPQGYARNPRDVFLYFVDKLAHGYKNTGGTGGTTVLWQPSRFLRITPKPRAASLLPESSTLQRKWDEIPPSSGISPNLEILRLSITSHPRLPERPVKRLRRRVRLTSP